MLNNEQIDRSKAQPVEVLADTLRRNSLSTERKPDELRSDRIDAPSITPVRPTTRPDTSRPAVVQRSLISRDQLVRWGLFALVPIALIAGAYWYVAGGQVMSTDDAYVEADKVGVSTDVSGIAQDIDVIDNQHVTAGQILYRLDPRQFQIALDNAKANLAQTALTIEAMKLDYQRMLSDIAAEQAQVELDQVNYNRFATLVKSDTVSQASYDQARFTLQGDQSKLASLKQQAEVALARLAGNPDIAVTDRNISKPRPRSMKLSASLTTP
jgi:multidrug resistance efflux pump